MTQGYASDINGDDTVMDEPQATISIDLSQLPPAAALSIAQAAGLDHQNPCAVGQWVKGEEADPNYVEDAEFHVPIEAAITALEELDIVENAPTEAERNA
jgi:hypothetical protein